MLEGLQRAEGFTLTELMVVLLLIGILTAIALPTFVSQAGKGHDASAKSDVRNARSVQTCAIDHNGDYTTCDLAASNLPATASDGTIAPTISDRKKVGILSRGDGVFRVAAVSQSGNVFTIERSAAGYGRCKTTSIPASCAAGVSDW